MTIDTSSTCPPSRPTWRALGEVRILREMRDRRPRRPRVLPLPGLARRIFEALADVNVVMISFAASDVNISVVVDEADAERAVHALHREFFSEDAGRTAAPGRLPV